MSPKAVSDFKRPGVLRYVLSPGVVKRSACISLVVGTVLSIANQYEALASGQVTSRLIVKVAFNFLVPFVVASTSAALNRPR